MVFSFKRYIVLDFMNETKKYQPHPLLKISNIWIEWGYFFTRTTVLIMEKYKQIWRETIKKHLRKWKNNIGWAY